MKVKEHMSDFPSLEGNYELTDDHMNSYQKNGHIMLRNVANAEEIAAYESVISQWMVELNNQDQPIEERDTYGKAFIQVPNLWQRSEAVRRFILAKRFGKIAADLMGVKGVRIYHDQALYKEPGGGHTPWHQDQVYWPLDTDKTITMWIPLVPISEQMGTMSFASCSHHLGDVSKMVISDESHKTLSDYISDKGLETISYGAMSAGDATFHSGWTLHSAPANPTDSMRKVMTVIYFADGTQVAQPDSEPRRNDLKSWLPGLKAGDKATSKLNPLVYSG